MDADERTTFEETPENLAAEEAAFEAAVNGADVTAPAPETTATDKPATEDQQQQQQTEQVVVAAEQQPVKEPTIADLMAVIEDQKTEQQKLRDKVFGKVGELQQRIDAAKTTSSGISPQARERLMNDFPELAGMLFDVQDAPIVAETQTPVIPAQSPSVSEDGFTETQRVEMRFLARDHRDWQQVVTSPEFAAWKGGVLSPEDSAKLDDSWDADFVSAKIGEFKAHRAATSGTSKTQQQKLRQERLDAALTPRGTAQRHVSSLGDDDEEAAMMASYKRR